MTAKAWELLQQCVAAKPGNELVFTLPDGKPVRSFRRTWTRVCAAAGVPELLFHDLRRSGIRNMRRHGISENRKLLDTAGEQERPAGARFGALVHATLAEVPLNADGDQVQQIAAPGYLGRTSGKRPRR